MVWGCFAHGDHSILQRHAGPAGLRLLIRKFVLQQNNDLKGLFTLNPFLFFNPKLTHIKKKKFAPMFCQLRLHTDAETFAHHYLFIYFQNRLDFLYFRIRPGRFRGCLTVQRRCRRLAASHLWTHYTNCEVVCKKAHQRLYCLRKLLHFHTDRTPTTMFAFIESISSFSLVSWFGHSSLKDKNSLSFFCFTEIISRLLLMNSRKFEKQFLTHTLKKS